MVITVLTIFVLSEEFPVEVLVTTLYIRSQVHHIIDVVFKAVLINC